jgi:hypothetical protein
MASTSPSTTWVAAANRWALVDQADVVAAAGVIITSVTDKPRRPTGLVTSDE